MSNFMMAKSLFFLSCILSVLSCASAYGVEASLTPTITSVELTEPIQEKTFTCSYNIPLGAIFVNVTWGKIVDGPSSHVRQIWTVIYDKDAVTKLSSSAGRNYEGWVKGSDANDLSSISSSHTLTILKYPSFEEEPDVGSIPGTHLDTKLITRDTTLRLTCSVTYKLLWHNWRTLTFSETTRPSSLVMVFTRQSHPAYDPFLTPKILPKYVIADPGQNQTFRCNYTTPPGMKEGQAMDLEYWMNWFVHIKDSTGEWTKKIVWTAKQYSSNPKGTIDSYNKPKPGLETKVVSTDSVTYESIQYTHAITLVSLIKDDSLFTSHADISYVECQLKYSSKLRVYVSDGSGSSHYRTDDVTYSATSESTAIELKEPSTCLSNPCQHGGTCTEDTRISGYTCLCIRSYGGINCEGPSFTISTESFDFDKRIGESVTFHCDIKGDWDKNQHPLEWNRVIHNTERNQTSRVLIARNGEHVAFNYTGYRFPKQPTPNTFAIINLKTPDAGVYECIVGGLSRDHLLTVTAPNEETTIAVRALDYLDTITKKVGESVTFKCAVDTKEEWDLDAFQLCYFKLLGNETNVEQKKETKRLITCNFGPKFDPFATCDRFVSPQQPAEGQNLLSMDLTVNNLQLNDTGLYECVVANSRVEFNLIVSEDSISGQTARAIAKPTGTNSTESEGISRYVGESVTFPCITTENYRDITFFPLCWHKITSREQGDPWKKIMSCNYKQIQPFKGRRFPPLDGQRPPPGAVVTSINLTITYLRLSDSAEYVCTNGPNRMEHVLTVIKRGDPVSPDVIGYRGGEKDITGKRHRRVEFECHVNDPNWDMANIPLCWFKIAHPPLQTKTLVLYNFVQQMPFKGARFPAPYQPDDGTPVTSINLKIHDLQPEDSAMYACVVGNKRVEYSLYVSNNEVIVEHQGKSSTVIPFQVTNAPESGVRRDPWSGGSRDYGEDNDDNYAVHPNQQQTKQQTKPQTKNSGIPFVLVAGVAGVVVTVLVVIAVVVRKRRNNKNSEKEGQEEEAVVTEENKEAADK